MTLKIHINTENSSINITMIRFREKNGSIVDVTWDKSSKKYSNFELLQTCKGVCFNGDPADGRINELDGAVVIYYELDIMDKTFEDHHIASLEFQESVFKGHQLLVFNLPANIRIKRFARKTGWLDMLYEEKKKKMEEEA